jgi:hypothetical protein
VDNSRITQSATGEAPAATGRRRRRSVLWISFLGAGLLLSTVWATGFADSNSTNGADNASVRVDGTPHAAVTVDSPYKTLITNPEDLSVDWNGYWGVLAQNTAMYAIDLSAHDGPGGTDVGTYFAEVLVKNTAADWDTQQYKVELFTDVTCSAANLGVASTTFHLLNVTKEDSYVSFPGLTTGHTYCIGVKATPQASEMTATFLRRGDDTVFPTATTFVGVLNRSA